MRLRIVQEPGAARLSQFAELAERIIGHSAEHAERIIEHCMRDLTAIPRSADPGVVLSA
jgi:hypothetical protein